MSTQGPRKPLEEKDAEITRLRGVLAYIADCLYKTQWSSETDDEYASALAEHIRKQLGAQEQPVAQPA